MPKKQKSKSHRDTWIKFSQSYLYLARLACQEILNSKHSKFNKTLPNTFGYTPLDLFIPLIYNIKHGIESYIKTLHIILDLPYHASSHDIKILFRELLDIIPEIKPKIYYGGDEITEKYDREEDLKSLVI